MTMTHTDRPSIDASLIDHLYIHIPFCMQKCIYCDFFSIPYDESLALQYSSALLREIAIRKRIAGELQTIYIGGGTPTVMPPPLLMRLLNALQASFPISPDAEITIEINPGTIDREKARALRDGGINRCSIGVQSFQDRELKLLGRIHDVSDVIAAIEAIRRSGIGNLSFDLMYGIPGQTQNSWKHNVAKAIELFPEHISIYELTPEKGTRLYTLLARNRIAKPHEDSIVKMYYHAIDRLQEAGFTHYEISNFAKGGFTCRHNLNYWNRGRYIGIGAGAHSFIEDRRIKNVSHIGEYLRKLGDNDLAVDETVEITCDAAIREFVFLGLRKMEGLNIKEFSNVLGLDIVKISEELVADGLLESDGAHIRLSRRGVVVSNTVIAKLFEELEK